MIRFVVALGVACALLTGYTLYQRSEIQTLGVSLDSAVKRADGAEAKLQRVQVQVQKANTDAAKARLKLKEALDANPVWRDTPVPVPVRDSLCDTLRCVKPRSVYTPRG